MNLELMYNLLLTLDVGDHETSLILLGKKGHENYFILDIHLFDLLLCT